MNKLGTDRRSAIIRALVEGNSIRATCRIVGCSKGAVLKLLPEIGIASDEFLNEVLVNLKCNQIQCDEIWSFCYSKARNTTPEKALDGAGDVWTWVAMDAETKLAITWLVGKRSGGAANAFIADWAGRIVNRPQISTDGFASYVGAIRKIMPDADHAVIEKYFGTPGVAIEEGRYSPAICLGCRKVSEQGEPDMKRATTSHVERQNLTMRMGMRRFTRLTNAFSKKLANLRHSVALHFMHYNFCRIHQSLRITPAMAAGVTSRVWEIEDIAGLLDGTTSK